MSASRRPAAIALALLLSGMASTARSQGQPPVIYRNLGTISISDMVLVNPSLYFRPIDDVAVRPGAAAIGLGGAFTARARGPVAIGWCPAGIADLESGELFVDGAIQSGSGQTTGYPSQLVIPGAGPIFTTGYRVDPKGGARPSTASGAMPLWRSGEMRLVGGISWRRFYDVSYGEETVNDFVFGGITGFPVVLTVDRKERGAVEAVGPTFALRVTPQLAVGANLNVLTGRWRSNTEQNINVGAAVPPGGERLTYRYDGVAADLGVRFALQDRVAVAARFTPGHTLKVGGGEYHSESIAAPGQPQIIVDAKVAGYEMDIPSSFSVGALVRPLSRLSVSADLTSHAWSETELRYTGAGPDSPVSLPLALPLQDVSTVHFGAEYLLFRPSWGEVPVRMGFRTAPQSFSDMDSTDVSVTDGDPLLTGGEIDAKAVSAGFGIRTGNVTFDFAGERLSYEMQKAYFDSPISSFSNPDGAFVRVDRSLTSLRFSATYRFGEIGP